MVVLVLVDATWQDPRAPGGAICKDVSAARYLECHESYIQNGHGIRVRPRYDEGIDQLG